MKHYPSKMVNVSNVDKHKVEKWSKYIKNVKLENEKKKENEKNRKEEQRIKEWRRRASLELMKNLKSNIPQIDLKNVIKDKDQSSERSDLGGDCICCFEQFTNTINKPVAFQCGHVVCLSCAPMIKKCPTCYKIVTGVIPLHI